MYLPLQKKSRFLILLVLMIFSFSSFVIGQNVISTKVLSIKHSIEQQQQKAPLSKLIPTVAQQNKLMKDFPKAKLLAMDKAKIASIIEADEDHLNLTIPSLNDKPMELLLYKYNLHAPDYISRTGSGTVFESKAVFYHGVVKGDDQSVVAISIFEDEMIGMIQTSEKQYTLTKLKGEKKEHILYDNAIIEGKNQFDCGTNIETHLKRNEDKGSLRVYNTANCVNMYIEVDYDIFLNKGSVTATANYIDAVMNEVSILYSNESIDFGVSEAVIWDVADPYTGPTTSNYLDQFRNNLNGVYNGDLAHLIGYAGGGGVAYVDVLCNGYYGVGYSGINSTYNNVPNYSWTVEVLTHEIGHNLGSQHTHDCAWNGNNTAIDGCGPAAGYSSGCNAPVPASGTIMSYCHLVSGVGIDFNLGFGPQPGDRIRDNVYNASCLAPCAPCETIGDPCDDGDACTTNDIYDANCNCGGTFQDDDGDGVCNADDQCPGSDDTVDANNNGTPDCLECSGGYSSTNFNPSPLTHSGSGSSTSTITYPFGTNDVSFTVSGISQKTNGNPNKKYIEEVTVTYLDGNGVMQTYGVYTAPSTSSVAVNIAGNVSEVHVNLKDVYDGSTTSTMSVNLTASTACEPDGGGCPDDDNDGVCNADDICPGGNDNVDSDGDGTPDFCDNDSCPNSTDQFANNPLNHQGSGSTSTNVSFLNETSDVTFDITNIGSKTNGGPSNRYIDKVTVSYVDGGGTTVNYGTYLGNAVSSVSVSISGIVQSVTVALEDAYDGDTGSKTIAVNFSDVLSCYTPAALPRSTSLEIDMYPNPASGSVFIDFGMEVENSEIQIFDILGKLVFAESFMNRNRIEIDINSFARSAIYLVKIDNKNGLIKTKKLVISK